MTKKLNGEPKNAQDVPFEIKKLVTTFTITETGYDFRKMCHSL